MAAHNELGKWGEELVARWLSERGYRIVERDWHSGHRDIDIIAIDKDTLVFVEVKTRRNDIFVDAAMAVNYKKMQNLTIAANHYIKSHYINLPMRFDVITVVGTDETSCKIEQIEDAFLPRPVYRR